MLNQLYFTPGIRMIAILLITAFIFSCSSPAVKHGHIGDSKLSPERAMNIDWSDRKVVLTTSEGDKLSGNLRGWSETGFILESNNKIDTLQYEQFRNYIMIQTRARNNGKGAKYGLYTGLFLAVLSSFLIIKSGMENDQESGDNSEPLVDDALGNPSNIFLAIITAPIIVATSTGIGSIIGGLSHKYEKLYFNQDEFKKTSHRIDKPVKPPIDKF